MVPGLLPPIEDVGDRLDAHGFCAGLGPFRLLGNRETQGSPGRVIDGRLEQILGKSTGNHGISH